METRNLIDIGSIAREEWAQLTQEMVAEAPHFSAATPDTLKGRGCGCGKEDGMDSLVVCLLCGRICHPECAFLVPDTVMEQFETNNWENYGSRGMLCICKNCTLPEEYTEGKNCAMSGTEASMMCLSSGIRIHKKHTCAMCEIPVHVGCCVYVACDIGSNDLVCQLPSFWSSIPVCGKCFNNLQINSKAYQEWLDPESVKGCELVYPSPVNVHEVLSAEQDIGVVPNSLKRRSENVDPLDLWSKETFSGFKRFESDMFDFHACDFVHVDKEMEGPGVPKPQVLENNAEEWKTRQSENRIPYRKKIGKIDLEGLMKQSVECTPNVIELWVLIVSKYMKEHEAAGAKKVGLTGVTILPMAFMCELLRKLHIPGNDELRDAFISLYKGNFHWMDFIIGDCFLVLPYVHELVADYGLIVVSPFTNLDTTVDVVVIEYCEDSLFSKNRYDRFIARVVSLFITSVWEFRNRGPSGTASPQISVLRMVCEPRNFRRVLPNDQFPCFQGGTSLCGDLLDIANGDINSFLRISVEKTKRWEPATAEFERMFQVFMMEMRQQFFCCFLSKIQSKLDSWIEIEFMGDASNWIQLGKAAMISLFTAADASSERLLIQVLPEKTCADFITTFRVGLMFERMVASLYTNSEAFKIFERVEGKVNNPMTKAVRFRLAQITIDIFRSEFYDKWLSSLMLKPEELFLESITAMNELIHYPIHAGESVFHDLRSFHESTKSIGMIFDQEKTVSGFDKLCWLQHSSACTIVELLHWKNELPKETMLFYTDEVHMDWLLKDKILSEICIPTGVTRLICLSLERKHQAVFDIDTTSKEVVVYDGQDGSPELLSKRKKMDTTRLAYAKAGEKEAADREWREYAAKQVALPSWTDRVTSEKTVTRG
jgi:hypothetical protein